MKKIWFLSIALMAGCLSVAHAQNRVEVVVNNIRNETGILMVGIFNSEKTFIKETWKGQKPKPQTGTVRVVFEDIPDGVYAVSVIHDENENGKLDSNFMGIPKEGFGFSNDAMGTFGPPSFEKAKFSCPVTQPLTITLKYL